MSKNETNIIANNKKARFDYFIEETFEAGIALCGTEVKSIRQGKVNLKDSYAYIQNGEIFISSMHISPYEQGNLNNVNPLRERKLLMKKSEINRLTGFLNQKGYTLVPLCVKLIRRWVKIDLGLGKGKNLHDKRDSIAERDVKREIATKLKEYNKY